MREQRDARRTVRAKSIFAGGTADYLESKVDYLARMIINDVVSEGKLFKDAYEGICQDYCLRSDEVIALQQSLIRHGWCSAYNSVGENSDFFNEINDYYIAPVER